LRSDALNGRAIMGVCAYAEACLEEAAASDAAATVFTSHCDQMRRTADRWMTTNGQPTFLFNLPATWQTATARQLYHSEMDRLGEFLVRLGGHAPTTAALASELRRWAEARRALLARRPALSARQFAEFVACFAPDTVAAAGRTPSTADRSIPLALVGEALLPSHWELLDWIEARGGRVELDATLSGERALLPVLDETPLGKSPLMALADAYFDSIVDVFQRPNTRFYSWLQERLDERRIRGIIVWRYTWCDLWHAEVQRLAETTGLPVLDLDAGDSGQVTPQIKNRVQAFLELLGHDSSPSANMKLKSGGRTTARATATPRFSARTLNKNALPARQYPPAACPAEPPQKITLADWDDRHATLVQQGFTEPFYGGPLGRHVTEQRDFRLRHLQFDNSPAALRLWNFLLTEEERLRAHRAAGRKLVGTMKDLGTVPVLAYSLPNVVAFYPDGAWWTPCLMECSDGLLSAADRLGLDESFCPVRAMVGAFLTAAHFPVPDLLTCSVGAVCDDFSAIAQRLEGLNFPIHWWEIPRRRPPEPDEDAVALPGGFVAPQSQVAFVQVELQRLGCTIAELAGAPLDDTALATGIRAANQVRARLRALRDEVFTAAPCPLPALEMLIAEMLAIHYCSDRDETIAVLDELLAEVHRRVAAGQGVLASDAVRVFWVNPVADLRAMNLLEDCGGRVCGTDYLFGHALEEIPEDLPPLEALARVALADPMVGSTQERAQQITTQIRRFGAEALVVSRIPGASHCARESGLIREDVMDQTGIPTLEIEVPPLCDALLPTLRSRLEALVETALARRAP
jgi:benzoyl-CoA reductase/2-hydroxyglutaryl-CoA dehydratase subunit BcrC/BadD/HgdB